LFPRQLRFVRMCESFKGCQLVCKRAATTYRANFLYLICSNQSPNHGVNRGQKVLLGRQPERFNSFLYLNRVQRLVGSAKYSPAGIRYSLHKSHRRRSFVISFCQFMQSCDPLFLFCDTLLHLEKLGFHQQQFVEGHNQIGSVFIRHRSN